MNKICFNCQYWQNTSSDKGECHRYPKPPGDSFLTTWPRTSAADWCGEHKTKEKQKNVKA